MEQHLLNSKEDNMEDEYYEDNDVKYLTIEVMSEILAEFSWPAPYVFDDSSPIAVVVIFPKSEFLFLEDFENNIHLHLSNDNTKKNQKFSYSLVEAMTILIPEAKMNKGFHEPEFIDNSSELPSLERVKTDLRSLCIIMQTYLLPSIQGDFSWVERYDAYIRNKNNSQ